MITAITILAILTALSVSLSVYLLLKARDTQRRLRSLTAQARRLTSNPLDKPRPLPRGDVMEMGQALDELEMKLETLEADLDTERTKLTALLATIGAGVIMLDGERRVTTLNNTAARIFKINPENAAGRPFIDLARDHEMDNIVTRCHDTGRAQSGTIQVGGRQYLELTAVPLSAGFLIMVQDLTNIRRLEKIRQDFIANISHELRTPIASCKAIVETLQDGAIEDKAIAADFLQRMQVETDKLAQMVNELSELTRIESGDLKLKMEPVDVAAVVDRVTERLKAQSDIAQLTLEIDIPRSLPPLKGDAERIEQVLVNLVHNAIKFTPAGGKVTLSSRVSDGNVTIAVSDTGIGIPADDLPHIFERFYKVDKARSGGGTGLGLAIAKHIVQAHGGDIGAESQEDVGTTITLTLPTANPVD